MTDHSIPGTIEFAGDRLPARREPDGKVYVTTHRGGFYAAKTILSTFVPTPPPTTSLVVTVTLPTLDIAFGWKGDTTELAASIKATLRELIGDDGGAYVPTVEVYEPIRLGA